MVEAGKRLVKGDSTARRDLMAERAFELGCVAVDAEEHGVGCRFTVGQLEELSRDYGRDAYSVNNPYGRGES